VTKALPHMLAAVLYAPDRGDVVELPDRGLGERVDDSELVRRAAEADEWARAAIFRRYVGLVAATAQRLLRDSNEVDDVVQETFLIAFEKLDRLIEPAALRGWLVQIAVRRVHRRFRTWKLWRTCNDVGAQLENQVSFDASPEQRAELALIDRALAKLPLRLRTPWVLRRVVGHALDDVALACECSLATVKRRLLEAESLVDQYIAGERP
jgi:RNA polymerase sigma-70 factor, ECF subfamily